MFRNVFAGRTVLFLFAAVWLAASGSPAMGTPLAAGEEEPPVELGLIDWMRDFDEAVLASKEQGKAILLLFQEVPG